jgi:hypothetical protein
VFNNITPPLLPTLTQLSSSLFHHSPPPSLLPRRLRSSRSKDIHSAHRQVLHLHPRLQPHHVHRHPRCCSSVGSVALPHPSRHILHSYKRAGPPPPSHCAALHTPPRCRLLVCSRVILRALDVHTMMEGFVVVV